jgi:hypothetical protein
MRVNRENERKIYVNPINYTARTRACVRSSMALQPRLGLLSKRRPRDDIADSATIVVVGCDLGAGDAFRIAQRSARLDVSEDGRSPAEYILFTIALIRFPIPRHGIEEF